MSLAIGQPAAAGVRTIEFPAISSARPSRLWIAAAGCAVMAMSGVGLAGYLQTPTTPAQPLAADAAYPG